jgi:hypothetical protein
VAIESCEACTDMKVVWEGGAVSALIVAFVRTYVTCVYPAAGGIIAGNESDRNSKNVENVSVQSEYKKLPRIKCRREFRFRKQFPYIMVGHTNYSRHLQFNRFCWCNATLDCTALNISHSK